MSENQKSTTAAPLPPGVLQAYTDAYKATYQPCKHLDAHKAGLCAAIAAAASIAPARDGAGA